MAAQPGAARAAQRAVCLLPTSRTGAHATFTPATWCPSTISGGCLPRSQPLTRGRTRSRAARPPRTCTRPGRARSRATGRTRVLAATNGPRQRVQLQLNVTARSSPASDFEDGENTPTLRGVTALPTRPLLQPLAQGALRDRLSSINQCVLCRTASSNRKGSCCRFSMICGRWSSASRSDWLNWSRS